LTVIEGIKDNTEDKIKAMTAYAEEHNGYAHAVFAKLQAAKFALESNDEAKALAIYNEIAADDSQEELFRQLGDLLVVQTTLDEGDPAELQKRLEPLMDDESAWRYSAYEYAGFLAIRTGDKAKAKEYFQKLNTLPEVPKDFQERANDMIRWLSGGV